MTQTVFDNKIPLYVASIEPHFNLMYDRQEGHISTLSLSDLFCRSRTKDGLVKTSHEDHLVSTHSEPDLYNWPNVNLALLEYIL